MQCRPTRQSASEASWVPANASTYGTAPPTVIVPPAANRPISAATISGET